MVCSDRKSYVKKQRNNPRRAMAELLSSGTAPGPAAEDNRKFSLKTVLMLAGQMIVSGQLKLATLLCCIIRLGMREQEEPSCIT
ncbi:hypothetical protein Dimus_024328 [Dionaea muscipula]